MSLLLPSSKLQATVASSLDSFRRLYLQQALSQTIKDLDLSILNAELDTFTAAEDLKQLASLGIRGEFLFPVPCVLSENPRLLGCYRLLCGFSQKEFFNKGKLGRFAAMEEKGRLPVRVAGEIPDLCRAFADRASELLRAIGGVCVQERAHYLRWIRFYLDFCQKYGHGPRQLSSIPRFLEKLASKKQSEAARGQASLAVHLLLRRGTRPTPAVDGTGEPKHSAQVFKIQAMEAEPGLEVLPIKKDPSADRVSEIREAAPGILKQNASEQDSGGASLEHEYRELEGAIKLRNYSGKTHAVYRMWVQKFQAFARSKPPIDLDAEDVKGFLTDLAVRHEVAGSTQNQAFNALLFFFRHVLRREFGKLDGVVRAKRKPYVPVVLSKEEVAAVISKMAQPYRLVALILYGCGLRLAECLELRVNCFNLDSRLLTIHDGKGQKDRTVPLPERVMTEIQEQMEVVRETLRLDLDSGSAGTFLPRQLGRKYKNASREFIWQWFFPAVFPFHTPAQPTVR